jgi:hypothetical protein
VQVSPKSKLLTISEAELGPFRTGHQDCKQRYWLIR